MLLTWTALKSQAPQFEQHTHPVSYFTNRNDPIFRAKTDFFDYIVELNSNQRGEFHISHDASLHTILSSFRTHVMLSFQQGRDS